MANLINAETINKYLNGTLESGLLGLFNEQLESNKELAEQVFGRKMMKETIEQYDKISRLRTVMSQIHRRHIDAKKRAYTTKQLTEQFKPCDYYEEELQTVSMRSSLKTTLKLIEPPKETNCDDSLFFIFDEPIGTTANLIIENNKETAIEQHELAAGCTNFTVSLSNYLPGRYYWKIQIHNESIMGVVFVQKELMPS